jgi:NTE family protein
LLSGGGARAAYQVGVLAAIAELRRARGLQHGPNPFPVLAGTSAGAINVAALACHADAFDSAVRRMLHVWGHMHTEQIYKADSLSVLRSGARWLTLLSLGWALARWSRMRPRSLLDNAPLKTLMNSGLMPFERIPQLIDSGHLHALAITASSYSSGQHITFFQTREALSPWVRDQRKAVQTLLTPITCWPRRPCPSSFQPCRCPWTDISSISATAPCARLRPGTSDSSGRQQTAGRRRGQTPRACEQPAAGRCQLSHSGPGGRARAVQHFLDTLAVDIERAERINHTLSLISPAERIHSRLRPIEVLAITPSERIDDIATRHIDKLPRPVRTLLATLGVRAGTGNPMRDGALASYLLFEQGYTRELIALGRKDAGSK